MNPKLWVPCLGRCGSSFLMDVLRALDVIPKDVPVEHRGTVKTNEWLRGHIYAGGNKANFWHDPPRDPRPFPWTIEKRDPFADAPPVVKDPRWCVTIGNWLDNDIWPPAALFLMRDPEKHAAAIMHKNRPARLNPAQVIETSTMKVDNLLAAARRCIERGIPVKCAWYPVCFEDPDVRAPVAFFLARHLGLAQSAIQAKMVEMWKPQKVTIR